MSEPADYPLGYSVEEQQRLKAQAEQLAEITGDVFRRAGLRQGMDVLDIGSGVGDVSLLAAQIVGEEGSVLGVERASSSVEEARRRVRELGLPHVSFVQCDLADFATDRTFDAIIGRFVLLYLPDPAAVLARVARHLKPGGTVAFLELDLSQIAQFAPSDLFLEARRWLLEGFAAGGTDLNMGSKLYTTFLRAGLPAPTLTAAQPIVGGPMSQGYADLVQGIRALLPVIEREEIAKVDGIGIDTLCERLRDDAVTADRVIFMSRLVGAWAAIS